MASDLRKRRRRIKIIVKKYNSFEEAEKAEVEFWRNQTHEEKLRVLDKIQVMHLRAFYPKVKKFQKVVRIIKRGEE